VTTAKEHELSQRAKEQHLAAVPAQKQESSSHKENSSDEAAQEYLKAIDRYKVLARPKSSHDLYQEIERSKELVRIKNGNKPSLFPDVSDSDVQKSTAYLMVLEERSKMDDPYASYYYGLHLIQICMAFGQQQGFSSTEAKVCNDAMERMKVAANSNDPRAMRAIGIMYNEGLGVTKSKYVAADWFYKSAKQYRDEKSREGALSSLEYALNLVPDHPGALKLRKVLLNE
jgi:TPR repeat protein